MKRTTGNLSDDDVNAQFDAIGASECGSGGELGATVTPCSLGR